MRRTQSTGLAAWVLAAAATASACADVVPASLFTDHMVIQREKPVILWGKADAGEKVTVSFAGQTRQATADVDGRWRLSLDAVPASTQGRTLTVKGNNTVTLQDVLVGDVWLCSGQSNMARPVSFVIDSEVEIARADHPTIRLFNLGPTRHVALQPEDAVDARWQVCTSESVKNFSAVGYFFGRELSEKLNVPVGLINSSWPGVPAESFMPESKLAGPALQPIIDEWQQNLANYDSRLKRYEEAHASWQKGADDARARGERTRVNPNDL
ncbi:MAG: sialate O-acetylesterase [Tepidisphaeraceae bacterium]